MDNVRRVLAAESEPISTREIVHSLATIGVKPGGSDPVSNMGAALSRAPDIENIRGRGWRLIPQKGEELS